MGCLLHGAQHSLIQHPSHPPGAALRTLCPAAGQRARRATLPQHPGAGGQDLQPALRHQRQQLQRDQRVWQVGPRRPLPPAPSPPPPPTPPPRPPWSPACLTALRRKPVFWGKAAACHAARAAPAQHSRICRPCRLTRRLPLPLPWCCSRHAFQRYQRNGTSEGPGEGLKEAQVRPTRCWTHAACCVVRPPPPPPPPRQPAAAMRRRAQPPHALADRALPPGLPSLPAAGLQPHQHGQWRQQRRQWWRRQRRQRQRQCGGQWCA